jgi:hypothetical protein
LSLIFAVCERRLDRSSRMPRRAQGHEPACASLLSCANGPADMRCHAPPLSRCTCGLIGACRRHTPHMTSWKINGWYTSTVPWTSAPSQAAGQPGCWHGPCSPPHHRCAQAPRPRRPTRAGTGTPAATAGVARCLTICMSFATGGTRRFS